jgi:hypothetical protein
MLEFVGSDFMEGIAVKYVIISDFRIIIVVTLMFTVIQVMYFCSKIFTQFSQTLYLENSLNKKKQNCIFVCVILHDIVLLRG